MHLALGSVLCTYFITQSTQQLCEVNVTLRPRALRLEKVTEKSVMLTCICLTPKFEYQASNSECLWVSGLVYII